MRSALIGFSLVSISASGAIGVPTTQSSYDFITTESRPLFDAVHDHVSSFDEPAFYWTCRHVRDSAMASAFAANASDVAINSRRLLDHPVEFRGQIVTVEGTLRSIRAYTVENRPGIGTLQQAELELADGVNGTVVVPADSCNVAVGTRVRAKGIFVKVLRYTTNAGTLRDGPLLVAPAMVPLSSAQAVPMVRSSNDAPWIAGATAAAAIVWLVARRASRRQVMQITKHARVASAPTASDFDWMTKHDQVSESHDKR